MSIYDSIMDHPHYQSKTRPHMPMTSRAAQFSPYAALVGYGEAVEETGRLTDEKIILDDDAVNEINRRLGEVTLGETVVNITYFIPDIFKEGGSYTICSGAVKKVDETENSLEMCDGTVIKMEDIFDISLP